MSTRQAPDDFEKYRLDVEIGDDCTLQRVRDSGSGTSAWQTWRRKKPLGRGAYGEVWQESWEDKDGDWHYRAVKAVKVCSEQKNQDKIHYKRELLALTTLSKSSYSNWFVNFYGWWMAPGNIFVAMEYLRYGDLSRYATNRLEEVEIQGITENVLKGLEIMHKEGFTHRDIKPQNILVVQKPPEFKHWWVKIADFGISKRILDDSESALQTTLGTRAYCAPEILAQMDKPTEKFIYSSNVDMWSLGCVLYNISSQGQVPFSVFELVRYYDKRASFDPKHLPIRVGDAGQSFVKALLKVEPERRPTATEALQHPWLTMAVVGTSESVTVLPPNSQSLSPHNFNSFLDSEPSTTSHTDIHREYSKLRPPTSSSMEDVAELNDTTQDTSNSPRRAPDGGFSETLSEMTPLRVEGTRKKTAPGLVDMPVVVGTWVEGVTSEQPEVRAPETETRLTAARDTNERTLTDKYFDTKILSTGKRSADHTKSDEGDTSPDLAASNVGGVPATWLKMQGLSILEKSNNGMTALHLAAHDGQLEVVKWLQGQGANINAKRNDGRTPAHLAAWNGRLEVVEWLNEQGADICARSNIGSTPLHLAAWNGHLEVVMWLKQQGLSIHDRNDNGSTPILVAGQNGHLSVIKWLKEQGASIDGKDKDGYTLLLLCAWHGHLELVRWLKEQGTSVHEKDDNGTTALHVAARNGHLGTVMWLKDQGASIYEKDNDGRSPLLLAVWEGQLEMVKWLRGQGAMINEKDEYGNSTLHMAAWNGQLEVVRWLKDLGMNIHEENDDGGTPLNMATDAGHAEVASLLEGQGAINVVQEPQSLHVSTPRSRLRHHFSEGFPRTLSASRLPDNSSQYGEEDTMTATSEEAPTVRIGDVTYLRKVPQSRGPFTSTATKELEQLFFVGEDKHFTVKRITLDQIQACLRRGADVNNHGGEKGTGWPLLQAAGYGTCQQVRYLLSQGADPSCDSKILANACSRLYGESTLPIVRMLIEHGAEVNAHPRTLICAVQHSTIEVIKYLIDQGADPFVKSIVIKSSIWGPATWGDALKAAKKLTSTNDAEGQRKIIALVKQAQKDFKQKQSSSGPSR